MPESVNLSVAFGLSPQDAIDYFARRGHAVVRTWNWQDMWQEQHARAFTVAKVADLDVLRDIRESLRTAISEGQTMAQWTKNLEPTLRARGWWGRREVIDKTTGEIAGVDLSAPWRLRTIFRTNTQTAMMAGHWRRFQANISNRPYWQYVAVMDLATRPAHAALHERVFRLDDPKAAKLWPPNDWGCRCRPRALSERDLARRGLKVEDTDKYLTEREDDDPATGGKITRTYYKAPGMRQGFATGAGWNYNVGEAGFNPRLDTQPLDIARAFVSTNVQGPAFARFLEGKQLGSMPVAVLDEAMAKQLGAKSRVVTFTADNRKKNFAHHPDLTPEDYLRLPQILQEPTYVVQDRDNAAAFVKIDEYWWHAAIKIVNSSEEVFMLSLRRTNAAGLARLLKKGNVLKKPEEGN